MNSNIFPDLKKLKLLRVISDKKHPRIFFKVFDPNQNTTFWMLYQGIQSFQMDENSLMDNYDELTNYKGLISLLVSLHNENMSKITCFNNEIQEYLKFYPFIETESD